MIIKKNIWSIILFLSFQVTVPAQADKEDKLSSGLILTREGVSEIRRNLGQVPLFDQSLESVILEVEAEIESGIEVPIPKDLAGGYTHERHKKNFFIAQKAGVLYQITGKEKYLNYVKELLLEYSKLYPSLPLHPEKRSYARGKIFWQSLNDANWLVYMSQAYASIKNDLSKKERQQLEKDLFRPLADFLSMGNPQFFNRIHNHSTWGNAAVGMIGLVMKDEELIQRALYGLEEDNIAEGSMDDDGGLIKKAGEGAGFIANIDHAFSPTGYYTEGPYYQRYAMYPFMIFAAALQNKKPELEIFQYRDQVLIKAVYTLLNLADADGEFFPLNDGQKGMSINSRELITSVGLAYYFGTHDPTLLDIAKKQGRVSIDDTGLAMARAIAEGKEEPFEKRSMEHRDGPLGDKGALSVIRAGGPEDPFSLVFKYTSQGDSHGHYDKLSFSLYDQGEEVIQDYGLARFVNIDQKNGGGYLKENTTWAKQTISHNTVSQNETSHFGGDFETGTLYHPERHFIDFSRSDFQIVSAKEENAYPGTRMHRTMAVVSAPLVDYPMVIDIFRINSNKLNTYDLPFYYKGQIMEKNYEVEAPKVLEKFGDSNGYQHLWVEAVGQKDGLMKMTWLTNNKFYTLSSLTKKTDSLFNVLIGATDPEFNLRRDPGFIIRKENQEDATFVSILEAHGNYSPVTEVSSGAFSGIKKLELLFDDNDYSALLIRLNDDTELLLLVSNKEADKLMKHQIKIGQTEWKWTGPYQINKI